MPWINQTISKQKAVLPSRIARDAAAHRQHPRVPNFKLTVSTRQLAVEPNDSVPPGRTTNIRRQIPMPWIDQTLYKQKAVLPSTGRPLKARAV